jgi:oligopeptide/dipeptide ABC transporter ATP-binding protein
LKPLLSVRNLSTRFDTFDGSVYAVNDVSFDLHAGETLAVVGESGSGKSVTMLSLLGLLPKSTQVTGSALFSPQDLELDLLSISKAQLNSLRGNKISIIFQDALRSLNPVMTVGEQITESLLTHYGHQDRSIKKPAGDGLSWANKLGKAFQDRLQAFNPVMTVGEQISESLITHHRYTKQGAHKRAVELLEMVGISQPDKRYYAYPHMFSGGMRQRAMIAIAISCMPDILIADEPTTALDVTIQAQIVELTRQLQQDLGIAVIWITHDLGVVAGIADRVMVMYGGTGVEIAPVDLLYETPGHPYTEGLLGAIPSIAGSCDECLVSIEGAPPDLFQEPKHCQFVWRCRYAHDRCWEEIPPVYNITAGQQAKCFFDMRKKTPRVKD